MQPLKSFPTKLIFETSSFLDKRSRHSKAIEDHTFVHGAAVTLDADGVIRPTEQPAMNSK